MSRVVHFEIHADDPERAARFYGELLGWNITKWAGEWEYWLIMTGPESQPGINGGLIRRRGEKPTTGQPVNGFVCTVDVANLDSHIAKAVELGSEIAFPKMPVQGIGWLAYLRDTEGNLFGMMQTDPTAGLGTSVAAG